MFSSYTVTTVRK